MPKAWERGHTGRARRELRTRVLVVCEGAKTEPLYFRGFPLADVIDFKVIGTGTNTDTLVREAIARRREAERSETPFNEVWCVFDRDSFPAERFNLACRLARENHIRVAVTHEAFELWYLLHFNFNDAAISRSTYGDRLSIQLGFKYRKNDPAMYSRLVARQAEAIRNAKTLLSRYRPWNPEAHNPSTNVHHLVERLNELAE